MADNILKNEFMWQEQQKKKKLYKNWKLYAIALGIIVIGTGTGLGIYYGINTNHSEVTKIALNTLNTSAISGKENMLEQDAFDAFIGNNQEKYSDLASNVEISSFTAPNYTLEGKLVVKTKANTTKYTGSVEITINAIGQTNLSDLNLDTSLKQSYTNQQDAFNEFLSNNSTITDLKDNIKTGTFTIPTYTSEGKLIINATTNGKYNGNLEISIPKLAQIDLNTLNTSAISGKENMLEQDAWNAFLNNNSTITDLKDNVETSFDAPTYINTGSLTITAKANNKYSGSIKVTINAIGQTNLNDLNLDTSLKQSYTNQQDAFNEFLSNNSTITDLKDNIETGTFTIPTYTSEGKLIINATTNGKYNGSLEVSIPKLAQIDLNTLNTSAISGKENMLEQDAWNAFLNNNSTITDLKDNVETSFDAPTYINTGSLTITAKANNKYSGSIKVTINAIGQTNLNDLNLDTSLKQSYTNQQDAFNEFLSNNSTITDLKDNIETGTFTIPTYTSEGKLIINATTNGKYNGSLEVSIPKLAQIDLNTLNTSPITGIENMVEQDAWNAFLNNNSTITDLKDNVETSFDAPTYINTGSLTITAKANSKYSGSIKVTINAIGQTDLNNLNLNKTISGTKEIMNDNTGQEALKTFLNANKTYSDLQNNIEINSFTAPKYSNKGSLTINAKTNSKYTGNITITINELIATDEDIVDTINNSGFTFGADASYNQSLNDFINIVIMGHNDFNEPYDQYWFIKGQLRDHLNDYDILNQAAANIEKYEFVKLTDINGNDLTDTALTIRGTTTIKFVYNFGSMTNQAVNFILKVK